MADQNKTSAKVEFGNELLNPSELFEARTRSHKIPVRGQKDFIPTGSDQQKDRLQQSLDEHWNLVSEERVERLGNLVKAVWIPSDMVVELQSPAGKFWQTMGFSAHGKQCLHPEEALYLMECGNLQVFYQDLPLSIQEGYERFLYSKTMSVQHYQVFGHLKRLGYVVNRFDPSSVPSQYERQLNLPQSRDRSGRLPKRKRSHSPTSRHTGTQEGPTSKRMEEEKDCNREEEDKNPDSLPDLSAPDIDKIQTASHVDPTTSTEGGQGRSWWSKEGSPDPDSELPGQPQSSPRWDFSSIPFPDLGSRSWLPSSLTSPDPCLLPGAVGSVGACDVAPWLQRLNLREVRMSRRECERERDRDRYRRDINQDRGVRRCRNWAEYQELQGRRSQRSRRDRPTHLWEGPVTPLHDPAQVTSTGELLDKISVIKSTRLLEGASSLKGSEEWRICFNIYQPDTVAEFKKSAPGKPYSRMCVCSFDGPVPDLWTLKLLAFQSGDVPVTYAVVDHGDISFYSFKDFQIPTDTSF
ncbi:tRNA-splicing endonuclease subunit Sen54 isoform X1 [Oncorhynchus masou masou]|uniref:tRNA-splicing endonuclease subunit Sen54 isoform X1 n=2 Tax=Oncorhynchus masou masou TaxID=90313 RepID=UPI003183F954